MERIYKVVDISNTSGKRVFKVDLRQRMTKEDYRKVVKLCDKGKCKVRMNRFDVCWCVRCGKLHADAPQRLLPHEQIVVQ